MQMVLAEQGEHVCDFLQRVLDMAVATRRWFIAVHNGREVTVAPNDTVDNLLGDWAMQGRA